ncbi:DUF3558 family protein [Nocardia transvalensis]|uniref:DUF3558 family protein n=1 Tax=Nocardia transvalensis TaxID=37333 RepID=UPI001895104D|nr:DUF3558 family protein [Nocardia transvalensis]
MNGNALWDPCGLGDEVWRQVGVDPATLRSDIGGIARIEGFKRCGGIDVERTCAVDIWAQIYTVEDFRRKEVGTEFIPISIAGREGLRYRPICDRTGQQCSLLFPAAVGSFSIEVLKLDPRGPVDPCARAIEVATVVVPLLPL